MVTEAMGIWPATTTTTRAEMGAAETLQGLRSRVELQIAATDEAHVADADAPDAFTRLDTDLTVELEEDIDPGRHMAERTRRNYQSLRVVGITEEGATRPIAMRRGASQGCPDGGGRVGAP